MTWTLYVPLTAGGPWRLHNPEGYTHLVESLDEALRRARAGGAAAVELGTGGRIDVSTGGEVAR